MSTDGWIHTTIHESWPWLDGAWSQTTLHEWRPASPGPLRAPGHLWPCGRLINDAGAHRVGCPDYPEGVRG